MIFVFGTFWFWLLLSVALVLVIISTETDWGGRGATLTMVATLLLLYWFGDRDIFRNIFSYLKANPGISSLIALGYFTIGVLWSIQKWYNRVQDYKEKVISEIQAGHNGYDAFRTINVMSNKGRIISWMCYWPFSLLWTALNDPIRKLFEYLFSKTKRIFESMSDKAMKEIEQARTKAKKG